MPEWITREMKIPFLDFMLFTGGYFLLGFALCAALVWINRPAIERQRRNR